MSPGTNVLALTATATSKVIECLEMKGCHIISHVPNKLNIKFAVLQKPSDVMEVLYPILSLYV